ncbi:hypothetical protein [Caballeronia grimmiae]|uniref:Uncharacterized protein n=1 Tax=Caballeronia grimmiae TaxID=1071679 RepID=A0A069P8N2_9BURK|nr:hypothetical protein [Caballeronia grimmiae]KDR37025.1 hypothetical protein BG57_09890 [Caballeronia grimmiae]GGD78335.1 hypothetical protein GCM10010985_36030 [Caballeronia grimmiae]
MFSISSNGCTQHRSTDPDPLRAAQGHTKFFRTRDNVECLHSFWCDIDVKPDKSSAYASQAEAVDALKRFVKETALPAPMIVGSGHGLHVYWPLGSDLPLDLWQRAATALKALAIGKGLKADHGCTADASRVLRPVGTFNWKDPSHPKSVRLLRPAAPYGDIEFAERLVAAAKPYMTLVSPTKLPKHRSASPSQSANAFVLDVSIPTVKHVEPIVAGCQQIREAAIQTEDVWRGMLSVVMRCQDGRASCHRLSSADTTRYRPEDTDAKLNTLERQQGPIGTAGMPMTCAAFAERRPGVCDHCRHFGKIKSPIVLGMDHATAVMSQIEIVHTNETAQPVAAAASALPFTMPQISTPDAQREVVDAYSDRRFELVSPLQVDEAKPLGVAHLTSDTDESGTQRTHRTYLCRQAIYPIANAHIMSATDARAFTYCWRIHTSVSDSPIDVFIDGAELHSPKDLIKRVSHHGIVVVQHAHWELLGAYMRAYIEHARKDLPQITLHDHFGWSQEGSRLTRAAQSATK